MLFGFQLFPTQASTLAPEVDNLYLGVITITGFFADPVHGGNHGRVGWALVGWDDSLEHVPPFGYYDALPRTRG